MTTTGSTPFVWAFVHHYLVINLHPIRGPPSFYKSGSENAGAQTAPLGQRQE